MKDYSIKVDYAVYQKTSKGQIRLIGNYCCKHTAKTVCAYLEDSYGVSTFIKTIIKEY
jgi:hypothetical protein